MLYAQTLKIKGTRRAIKFATSVPGLIMHAGTGSCEYTHSVGLLANILNNRHPHNEIVLHRVHERDVNDSYGFRCVGLLAIVPPQGCEAILIEIISLEAKRYC